MCGIVGVFPVKQAQPLISSKLQQTLALWFHNEVLFPTIKRGKDATGIVVTYGTPNPNSLHQEPTWWGCLKQPVDVEDFFLNDGSDKRYTGQDEGHNFETMMRDLAEIDRPLTHVIGHARYRTKGSELNFMNNHPIIVNNIIGVHNGGIKNYDRILNNHKINPLGEVDSEVIFQLFAEQADDRALTWEDICHVYERLEGPRAVLAFNSKYPSKVAYFHDNERPLELAYLQELGLLVFCSERDFLKSAVSSYQRLRVLHGHSLITGEKLPRLSNLAWTNIFSNEGGLLDLDQVMENQTVNEFIQLKKLPPLLEEYRISTSTTSASVYDTHWKASSGYSQISTTSSPVKQHHLLAANSSAVVNESLVEEEKADGEVTTGAIVEDISGYEVEVEDAAAGLTSFDKSNIYTVDKSVIFDDTAEENDNVQVQLVLPDTKTDQVDDPGSLDDKVVFNDEELRKRADDVWMTPEFAHDQRSVFNRLKGQIIKLFCLNIPINSESDAQDCIEMAYGESFADGFVCGWREKEKTDEYQTDENYIEEVRVLQGELDETAAKLKEAKLKIIQLEKQRARAAGMVANLKEFIFATLIAKNLASVTRQGKVAIDNDLLDFLDTESNGFAKVEVDNIVKLFSDKQVEALDRGSKKRATGKRKENRK